VLGPWPVREASAHLLAIWTVDNAPTARRIEIIRSRKIYKKIARCCLGLGPSKVSIPRQRWAIFVLAQDLIFLLMLA